MAAVRLTITSSGAVSPLPAWRARVQRDSAWPVGRATLMVPAGVSPPVLGDQLTLKASSPAGEQTCFTGVVAQAAPGRWGTTVVAYEPAHALVQLHRDGSWQQTSADQIIRDLASETTVTLAEPVIPGAILPWYTVARERSALTAVQELCQLSGGRCWSDADGQLQCALAPVVPSGLQITDQRPWLELRSGSRATEPAVRTQGAGALGQAGPGSERWLTTKPPGSGASSASRSITNGALAVLADIERCQFAAEQGIKEQQRWLWGRLPEALPIDLQQILLCVDLAGHTGPHRCGSIDMRWDAERGLVQDLTLWEISV